MMPYLLCSSTCDGDYRHFEPGTQTYVTPSDGPMPAYLLQDRKRKANVTPPQWPTLTFPILNSSPGRVMETSQRAVPTQNLRVFKKLDILFVNDPGRILEMLEELLDLVPGLEHSEAFLSPSVESQLRHFILVARYELRAQSQRRDSMFDYKPWYMHECGRTIDHIQTWADNPTSQSNNPAGWVSCAWVDSALRHVAPALLRHILNRNQIDFVFTTHLIVKTLTGKKLILRVQWCTTVSELKQMIQDIEGIPTYSQVLISAGRKLMDNRSISDYNLSTGYYVNLVLPYRGAGVHYYDQELPNWLLYKGNTQPPYESVGPVLRHQQESLTREANSNPRRYRLERRVPYGTTFSRIVYRKRNTIQA